MNGEIQAPIKAVFTRSEGPMRPLLRPRALAGMIVGATTNPAATAADLFRNERLFVFFIYREILC